MFYCTQGWIIKYSESAANSLFLPPWRRAFHLHPFRFWLKKCESVPHAVRATECITVNVKATIPVSVFGEKLIRCLAGSWPLRNIGFGKNVFSSVVTEAPNSKAAHFTMGRTTPLHYVLCNFFLALEDLWSNLIAPVMSSGSSGLGLKIKNDIVDICLRMIYSLNNVAVCQTKGRKGSESFTQIRSYNMLLKHIIRQNWNVLSVQYDTNVIIFHWSASVRQQFKRFGK